MVMIHFENATLGHPVFWHNLRENKSKKVTGTKFQSTHFCLNLINVVNYSSCCLTVFCICVWIFGPSHTEGLDARCRHHPLYVERKGYDNPVIIINGYFWFFRLELYSSHPFPICFTVVYTFFLMYNFPQTLGNAHSKNK